MGHVNFTDAVINDVHDSVMICGPAVWDLMQGPADVGQQPGKDDNPGVDFRVAGVTLSFGGKPFATQDGEGGLLTPRNKNWSLVLAVKDLPEGVFKPDAVQASGVGGEGVEWSQVITLQGKP